MGTKASFKGLFFMILSTFIIVKMIFFFVTSISSTSNLIIHGHGHGHDHDHGHGHYFDLKPPFEDDQSNLEMLITDPPTSSIHVISRLEEGYLQELEQPPSTAVGLPPRYDGGSISGGSGRLTEVTGDEHMSERGGGGIQMGYTSYAPVHEESQLSATLSKVKPLNNATEVLYHDKDIFLENYKQMNKTLQIYIYPHAKTDPFANIFLPDNHGSSPGGNYASESYFKLALSVTHFVTQDPSKADLFFLPFSIASMRHDKRIGVGGIKDFIKDYIFNISHNYPFWNRTGGADHFYVTCHSIGRTAMEKAPEVSINAIQVVCSSSYFLQGYTSHKDASIPQIWPRPGPRPTRHPSKRERLAFYAGAMNSRVRESLVQTWINDSEIDVYKTRLKTPYSESLLGSKFCIHAKGFEVNTARVGDAIYYGCVPVILADHYDLPFGDVLNWNSFSVVVSTQDIVLLKRILKKIVDSDEYIKMQKNVLQVQKHFEWHKMPVDFDTFYMVMYELWLRRSSIRIHLFN